MQHVPPHWVPLWTKTPNPFAAGRKRAKLDPEPKPKPKAKPKTKAQWACCFICDTKIDPKSPSIADHGICCDGSLGTFHLKCADLRFLPKYNLFPCPLGCNPRDRHDQ